MPASRSAAPSATASTARVLIPVLAGAAVAVALGAYGRIHDPSGRAITTLGFSGVLNMKAWLTTGAAALALVQLLTALRMFGRIGTGTAPGWVRPLHRTSGAAAVLLTLPVAYHCLWSLGFADYDRRTLVHSVLGCVLYGALVAKLLSLRMRQLPGWALPWLGGLTFATLVALWLSSSLWFFRTVGFPEL